MNKQEGFTLIELMIVVAIVGILAAIAYPSYQEQVQKTRRADAQADLMELSSFMERFFTENNRYDQGTDGNAIALPFASSPQAGTVFYALTLVSGATTYTLTADPAGTPQAADRCGTMTLTQTGVKTPVANCW
jgi:type IV pilus assembly protein PilE